MQDASICITSLAEVFVDYDHGVITVASIEALRCLVPAQIGRHGYCLMVIFVPPCPFARICCSLGFRCGVEHYTLVAHASAGP